MDSLSPFEWRHFEGNVMPLCVRWYLRYALSYRDVEEFARERGLMMDHTTVFRSVQRYASELDRWCRPSLCGRRSYHHPRGGRSSTARSRSWSPLIPLWCRP
jgi:transposase-like protein